MALSALDIASRALLKLGAQSINGFDDGSTEAELANALYAPVRDAMLSAYPWSFATTQGTLARLATAPIADFSYAYQLPDGFLRALSAGLEGRGRGVAISHYWPKPAHRCRECHPVLYFPHR